MLKLTNVCAGYGDFRALFDISLEVKAGEAVGVLGANGAGKTTLMRAISGMIPATAGSVVFEGTDLNTIPPHSIVERGLAHVPEGRRLFPKLSVWDNLRMGAYSPEARKHFKDSIEHVFTLFPRLKERRQQVAGTMSGGEQQMCAIGRALMSRPKLLLFDEPSAGLAPVVVEQMFDLVRQVRDEGITVLLVEQNVTDVLDTVDRAYVLDVGRITLAGKADELRDSPEIQQIYLGL
ncbi:ABC transporter ATP-binding protein [Rhizobium sp. LjRoot30]|uniref:ABC transporter ATP-binding protein n=1 Tax=Rhizobium sp. LjRoot30 TaxID=3342320 RepID=UPI003ECF6E40